MRHHPQRIPYSLKNLQNAMGNLAFRVLQHQAISFSLEGGAEGPADVELRVENIVFGKGQPTEVEDNGLIPAVYSLSQNYPNPFNPSTTIQFGLPEPASVSLEVFDMLGRQVMHVTQQDYIAGRHKLVLDASRLASGAYIYRLVANKEVFTRVMHLVK